MVGLPFRDPVAMGTHFIWFLLAIPGAVWLWRRSHGDRAKQISLLIYGVSGVICFGASALFHGVRLPPAQVMVFETLDYIGIFLFMAGTCTPIAYNLLEAPWRWFVLRLAWSLATLGIVLRLFYPDAPHWLYTLLYVLLGWGLSLVYYVVVQGISTRALRPLVVGGVLYTIGAVLNTIQFPPLAFHAIFHLFVMAGSLVHFGFMMDVVVPRPRHQVESVPAVA